MFFFFSLCSKGMRFLLYIYIWLDDPERKREDIYIYGIRREDIITQGHENYHGFHRGSAPFEDSFASPS